MKNALVYPTEFCRSSKNLCVLQTSVICQLSQNQALNGWEGRASISNQVPQMFRGGDFGASVNELGVQLLCLLPVRELTALSVGPSWQPTHFLPR